MPHGINNPTARPDVRPTPMGRPNGSSLKVMIPDTDESRADVAVAAKEALDGRA
jgi:hypothetical protein